VDVASLPDEARAFLDAMRCERRLAERTVEMYALALSELIATLDGRVALVAVQPNHIRRAAAKLAERGQAPRSVALALSAWRAFYRWLARRDGIEANPALGVKAPKAARLLPKALVPDATHQLMEVVPATPTEWRDHAMFELLYSSGLRLAELVGLDLRPSNTSICWLADDLRETIVTGKGGKRRSVPVGVKAAEALARWLAARHELALADEPALFVGARGARISPRVVQLQLKAWALRAGLPSGVSPHVLRHSFASHVLQSSGDLRAVQEMLGHASLSTTQVYTRLDFQHLAIAYDAAHPRAKRRD